MQSLVYEKLIFFFKTNFANSFSILLTISSTLENQTILSVLHASFSLSMWLVSEYSDGMWLNLNLGQSLLDNAPIPKFYSTL